MTSTIGTPAVGNPISAPIAALSGGRLSCRSGSAGSQCAREADELSLSQPGLLTANDGTYQRTSLKIRVHSETEVADDGDVVAMSQTKLRFRYDFEAADGTSIHIRAQASLNYAQTSDSDDGSQTTKLRVAARVSILQENVSNGLAPLQETPDISTEANEFISQAIDLFQQVIDATTSAFLDSDPLDGDNLIAGLVEAFNGLSAAIDSMFPSPLRGSRGGATRTKLSRCSKMPRRIRVRFLPPSQLRPQQLQRSMSNPHLCRRYRRQALLHPMGPRPNSWKQSARRKHRP